MPKRPIEYKPLEIHTVHPRWTPVKLALLVVYAAGFVALMLDIFVWRP